MRKFLLLESTVRLSQKLFPFVKTGRKQMKLYPYTVTAIFCDMHIFTLTLLHSEGQNYRVLAILSAVGLSKEGNFVGHTYGTIFPLHVNSKLFSFIFFSIIQVVLYSSTTVWRHFLGHTTKTHRWKLKLPVTIQEIITKGR